MKRVLAFVIGACMIVGSSARAFAAEESKNRNPIPGVALSTLCGAAVGLMLGGAIALVNEDGDTDDDILRWSVAGGTFVGFGYGIYYHVIRQPKETALLELRRGGPILHAALPSPGPDHGVSIRFVSTAF